MSWMRCATTAVLQRNAVYKTKESFRKEDALEQLSQNTKTKAMVLLILSKIKGQLHG